MFQSTYLYKVRRISLFVRLRSSGFNPRTYIRYDYWFRLYPFPKGRFNPRTYIRYDKALDFDRIYIRVSIHVPI